MNMIVEVIVWVDASIALGQDPTSYNSTAVMISTGTPCNDLVKDKWGHKWLRLVHNSHLSDSDFINIPIESIIYRRRKKFKLPKKLEDRG